MRSHLKEYSIKIKTLGPLHIGSGDALIKKNYAHMKKEHRIYLPDQRRMFQEIAQRKLTKEYADYLNKNHRLDLSDWFRNMKIKEEDWKQWMLYSLSDRSLGTEDRTKKDISLFMKDAYGMPFVPGSSLKGALRTALLATKLNKKQKEEFRLIIARDLEDKKQKNRGFGHKQIQSLEASLFHTLNRPNQKPSDAVNSIMSGLKISDSKPLNLDQLTLAQKIDFKPDHISTEKEDPENALPIYKECLKPGTEIEFTITMDAYFPYSMQEIEEAIRKFYSDYQYFFVERYKDSDLNEQKKNLFYLGGGSGFATKTVNYSLFENKESSDQESEKREFEKSVQFTQNIFKATLGVIRRKDKKVEIYKLHKHDKDSSYYQISPHTIKETELFEPSDEYDSQYVLYEFGLCEFFSRPL